MCGCACVHKHIFERKIIWWLACDDSMILFSLLLWLACDFFHWFFDETFSLLFVRKFSFHFGFIPISFTSFLSEKHFVPISSYSYLLFAVLALFYLDIISFYYDNKSLEIRFIHLVRFYLFFSFWSICCVNLSASYSVVCAPLSSSSRWPKKDNRKKLPFVHNQHS